MNKTSARNHSFDLPRFAKQLPRSFTFLTGESRTLDPIWLIIYGARSSK